MLFGLSILPSRHPPPVWSLAVLPLLFRSRQHSANLPLDGARSSETDPARCGTRHFVVAPLFGLLGGLSVVTLQSAFRPPRNGSPCRFSRRLPGVFAGLSPLPRGWPAAPWTKRNAQKNFFKKFVFFALASTAGLKIPSQYLEHFPEVPLLSLSRGGVLSSGRRVALAACSQLWSCHARSFGYCLPERERLVHELRPGLLRCSCH